MMEQAWPHIEPLLTKACADSRGEFSIPLILANLEHWPILAIVSGDRVQAVMVTCVSQQPHRRVLDCLIASGDDAAAWPAVDDDFDKFARGYGCAGVRIPKARPGWVKHLPHWKITGAWFVPREAHSDFAPICVPYAAAVGVRRALRWTPAGYMMEREI